VYFSPNIGINRYFSRDMSYQIDYGQYVQDSFCCSVYSLCTRRYVFPVLLPFFSSVIHYIYFTIYLSIYLLESTTASTQNTMSALSKLDRIKGSLLGFYCGDSLAMPVHWYVFCDIKPLSIIKIIMSLILPLLSITGIMT